MTSYRCPLCQKEMPRDLAVYLDHTQSHVIDQIKKEHPEWVTGDGVCGPCVEYYKKQLKGEAPANIGPSGRRRRFALGVGMLAMSVVLGITLRGMGAAPSWRLLTFLTTFPGMLGLIQARERTCAFLAEFCMRDKESGGGMIKDLKVAQALKNRGRGIFLKSILGAALLTAVFYFVP